MISYRVSHRTYAKSSRLFISHDWMQHDLIKTTKKEKTSQWSFQLVLLFQSGWGGVGWGGGGWGPPLYRSCQREIYTQLTRAVLGCRS